MSEDNDEMEDYLETMSKSNIIKPMASGAYRTALLHYQSIKKKLQSQAQEHLICGKCEKKVCEDRCVGNQPAKSEEFLKYLNDCIELHRESSQKKGWAEITKERYFATHRGALSSGGIYPHPPCCGAGEFSKEQIRDIVGVVVRNYDEEHDTWNEEIIRDGLKTFLRGAAAQGERTSSGIVEAPASVKPMRDEGQCPNKEPAKAPPLGENENAMCKCGRERIANGHSIEVKADGVNACWGICKKCADEMQNHQIAPLIFTDETVERTKNTLNRILKDDGADYRFTKGEIRSILSCSFKSESEVREDEQKRVITEIGEFAQSKAWEETCKQTSKLTKKDEVVRHIWKECAFNEVRIWAEKKIAKLRKNQPESRSIQKSCGTSASSKVSPLPTKKKDGE